VKHKTLKKINALLILALFGGGAHASGADQELLDILLKNGAINKDQHSAMVGKEGLASSQLLDILSKNGTITKDQYVSLTKKDPALVPAAPAAAVAKAPSDGTHVTFGHNGGLEIVSNVKEKDKDGKEIMDKEVKGADGKPVKEFSLKLGGRVQVDSQVNFNDNGPPGTNLANGVGFRRARIYTEGILFKDYEYRFEYDFARNNGGSQGITDAYIKYIHFYPFALTIGQQNEGKSMESAMSNNYLTFIERSMPNNAFIEQGVNSKYQLGVTGEYFAKAWDSMPYTIRGGITTESVGAPGPGNSSDNSQGMTNTGANNANGTNINRNAFSGNTSYQVVARGTLAPIYEKDHALLHMGLWGSWRNINNNIDPAGNLRTGGWRYQSQPDSAIDRTNWIDTGNLTNFCTKTSTQGCVAGKKMTHKVDNVTMFGAELAGTYGPFHGGAEYMQAQIAGDGYASSDTLDGFYVYGGWFITGENRPYDYKKGTWDRLIPKANFLGGDGWGAFEVAYRYDLADMNTKNISGGSLDAGTLAVNWYLSPRVRLLTNWVHVFSTNNGQALASSGGKCTFPTQGSNAAVGCFNGLSPDIWNTAVRIDY